MLSFRLLGEVGAATGEEPVDVGHARQRAVLAVLLLDVNRPVPVDALIDRVWGEELPRRPKDALYAYLSRLRAAAPIERRHGGYVLTADPMTVDVHRFDHLAERARAAGDDPTALTLFDEALGLWRGVPFAGLESLWLNEVRERLERRRQAVELDRGDVRLRLGRHDLVLAEAPAATTNERLAGQVMLALHHDGRQADALRYFEGVRARLAEELGADPSAELRGTHQRILTTAAPPAVPRQLPASPPAVPRQLPASPPAFSARTRELATLGELLGTSRLVAVTGGGGMGKTWLALRWAHDNASRFPDGQLYVNLRGFDPAGAPVDPATAIRDLLDGLGAAPATVPAGLEARSALYRSMLADRRVLVVLDNARDTAQLAPLLPGGGSCATVVTSRNQLTGLVSTHGAGQLPLESLTDAEATGLLTRRLGPARVAEAPEAVREIVRHCAGLPLALGIAAARATTGPGLAALAAELRAARLDALDSGEVATSLRAVFSVSYTALDEETARAARLLARAPGVDIGLPAATHLLAPGDARQLLRRLTTTHLVREHQPDRFRMHDLVRLHTTELACESDGPALDALTDYYRHTAGAAMKLLVPNEHYRRPPVTEPAFAVPVFDSFWDSRDWLDAERPNLVAAAAGDRTGRLAWTLFRYLDFRGHYHDALTLHTGALAASSPDQPGHAYALLHRGLALSRLDRDDEALGHHEQALRQAERHGDAVLAALAALGLATAHERLPSVGQALGWYTNALTTARRDGQRHLEGLILNDLGAFHLDLGRYDEAAAALNRSGDIAWEFEDLGLGAYVISNLGEVYEHLGQQEKAVEQLNRALDIARHLGSRGLEVGILTVLGRASGAPEYDRLARALASQLGVPIDSVTGHHGDGGRLDR